MNFRNVLLLSLLFLNLKVLGQRNNLVGHWTSYLSNQKAVEIIPKGDVLYTITEGGLFSYNISSKEIQAFSPIDGLSGVKPSCIYYDSGSDLIFVGFPDGMINYFSDPNAGFGYVTDIARNENLTSKAIRRITSYNGYLYMATDFGLVIFDIARKETKTTVLKIGTNDTGIPVTSVSIFQDTCWISLDSKGLYYAPLTVPNISDPSVWVKESGSNGLPSGKCKFVCATSNRIIAELADSVYWRDNGGIWSVTGMPKASYRYLNASASHVVGAFGTNLAVLAPDGTVQILNNYSSILSGYTDGSGVIWIGDELLGLQRFEGWIEEVSPAGPRNNYVSQLAVGKGELYIAPKGKAGSSGRWWDRSGIPYYSSANGGWKLLTLQSGDLHPEIYQDFCRAVYNAQTGHAFIGSWGEGIVELYQGDTVAFYTHANSGLSWEFNTTGLTWTRVSGLDFDAQGNLWSTLMLGDHELNMMTPEKEWYLWDLHDLYPIGLVVDGYGTKWINNQGLGVVAFNENGTYDTPGDDQVKYLNTTSGSGLSTNSIYDLAVDKKGQLWLGTDQGATVIYDPGSVFTQYFSGATAPIIDGFPLLRDQKVTAIAVDGGNRKWFGTENGAYLISEDGTEQLTHFTTENSPLPDNDIKDIAIDGSTGEIFFATNQGLVSFMGDATEGGENSDSLYVFPNPVAYNYSGQVVVTGTVENAQVKITTADGHLVRELKANGGQTVWDLRDTYGNTIQPGIYFVMVATQEGQGGKIIQVAILESK